MKSFLEYLTELSIQAAASFAATYHKGQTRKLSGDPYVVHPEAVFNSIKKLGIKDRNILTAIYICNYFRAIFYNLHDQMICHKIHN